MYFYSDIDFELYFNRRISEIYYFNVFSANIEINKVRKQKEIDLAGLQAGLKRAQSKINSLEQEVQQKVSNFNFLLVLIRKQVFETFQRFMIAYL